MFPEGTRECAGKEGEGNHGDLSSIGNETGHTSNQEQKPIRLPSEADFSEWFRGFLDA